MKKLLLLLLVPLAGICQVSRTQVLYSNTDPSGSCPEAYLQFNWVGGNLWGCESGTWVLIASPGGSTPTGPAGGVLSGTYPNPGFATSPAFTGTPIAPKPASSSNSTQVATTNWVQQKLAALNPATAVAAATVAVLPNTPTYNNGTAGVGATLTAGSHAALVIDGYTVLLNDRLLINNQASALQNGVYTCTTLGSGSVNYVLTRASDFNTVSEINTAGVIPVTNGTVNNGTTWALDTAITTIGTSAINYDQTNAQPPVITNVNGVACTAGVSPGCTAGLTALTGDVTASGNGSQAATLATVNSGPGSCGDATHVCAVTTNGKGLVTAQTATAITAGPTTNQNIRTIGTTFGDMTSTATALSGSAQSCVLAQSGGTIQRVVIGGYPSGSATVDVRTVALASWTGPASTSTITASDIPALSSAALYTDSTLTGWTTTLAADTWVCFYLTSPSTVTGLQVELKVAAN